jgi:hypothetical protein
VSKEGNLLKASEAISQEKTILGEGADIPIVDVFKVDLNVNMTDTFSHLLLPVIPREECKLFFESVKVLTQWYSD